MLSAGAFNALLKTLEEPPAYVLFILATTDVQKIPVTVLSRCQRYDFKRITADIIAQRLKELTVAEQIQAEDKALAYIAKAADGALRDALSLLDQCAAFYYGEMLTYDRVLEVLGAVDVTVFGRVFRAAVENRTGDCIACLEELVGQGRELGQFVVDFIWYMRNLLLLKSVENPETLLDMSEENQSLLKEEANRTNQETLLRYIRIFSDLSNQLRYSSQKRVLIEIAFIKLTRPQMEQNLDSLVQRIAGIEKQLETGALALAAGTGAPTHAQREIQKDSLSEPEKVVLPKAQLEDLNLIRKEWGKVIREQGGLNRAAFRDTYVEPGGDGCLCIVFSDQNSYMIGNRLPVLAQMEQYVEEQYQKAITFKARLRGGQERTDTIYISDEELKANILMDVVIEG